MVEMIISDEKLTLALPESEDYYVKPLEFPWGHIAGARADSKQAAVEWYGRLMFFSSGIPDALRPGVYYEDGKNVFWGIDDPQSVIVLSLKDEPYDDLFIEVENPQRAIEIIENVLKDKGAENNNLTNGENGGGRYSDDLNGEKGEVS